jgi:4-amino-4-deoxy-L-arabinose transferase-like glycosyltransferase
MRVQAYALPGMLLVALTLPGIGQGWFRTDAPRYAALSMRVFDGGPWWGPRLGELPYFNKPPLAFWAQGLVYQVTGPELWATRATHLVVALAGLLITVDLVRRLSGRRAAMLAGVSLATTLEFFRYARTFSLDLWLVALFAAAAWLVAVGARRDRSWWIVAAGVPLGLSLLVKPMLAAVPALVLAVWLVWIGRPRPRKLGALLGAVLVAIAVAAPWHVAMAATYGEAFLSTYFGSQTVGRVEGTMAEDHPWWFYLVELPKGAGPWVVTAALCVVAVARGRIGSRDRWLWRLAVVGALVWIVLPSLLGDRRPRYPICSR